MGRPPRHEERAALARARARLDRLAYYPRPVRMDRVRIRIAPWLFRLPGFRRRGYHHNPYEREAPRAAAETR